VKEFITELQKQAGIGWALGNVAKLGLHKATQPIGKGIGKLGKKLALPTLAGIATTAGLSAGGEAVKAQQKARFGHLDLPYSSTTSGLASGLGLSSGPVGLLTLPAQMATMNRK
jgi:hypothetical protein